MIDEREVVIDIDKEYVVEEKLLQTFQNDYNIVKMTIKRDNYSTNWDELLQELNDNVAKGFLENLSIRDTPESKGILFYLACVYDDLKLAEWLINNGADVDCVNSKGDTPLHLAVQDSNIELVQLLIENEANIDCVNSQGNTPLHLAAENGSIELAQLLIENEANIDCVNSQGNTPLHLAAENGYSEYIEHIMNLISISHTNERIFVDFYKQNIAGNTALHLAAENGYLECVKILSENIEDNNDLIASICVKLMYGKTDYLAENNNKETALHLAIKNWHRETNKRQYYKCIEFLIEDIPKSEINQRDQAGKTALHLAVSSNVDIWMHKKEILMSLLKKTDDSSIDKVYHYSKQINDEKALKVFQNYFLKQKKKMEKSFVKLKKQESYCMDYVLYAANLSMVIEASVTLYQKFSQFSQNELIKDFISDGIIISSKIISLLTIPFMVSSYKKHRKLDLCNKTLENCQIKINEVGELNKKEIVVDEAEKLNTVQSRSYSAVDMCNNHFSKSSTYSMTV